MYFFINSLISDVSLFFLGIITIAVIDFCWRWSSNWWNSFCWHFTSESIESIAWLLFTLCKSSWFVKPLESWVLKSILWVSFLYSSPWLWENRSVVGSKSMNFFIDSLVTNIFLGVVMFMVMFVLLFKLSIVPMAVIANSWRWTTDWWNTFDWNFTVKTIKSIAWLLFNLCKCGWFVKPLESRVFESILWISFLDSSPWLWEYRSVVGSKSMDFLINSLVTDILLFLLSKSSWFIEPLESWVLETILWISLLYPSPRLWEYRSVVGCKSMDFLINSLITDISLLLLCKCSWFIKPLEFWVLKSIDWVSFLNSSPWLWEYRSIISSKSMDFLIDTLVSNVLLVFFCKTINTSRSPCWFIWMLISWMPSIGRCFLQSVNTSIKSWHVILREIIHPWIIISFTNWVFLLFWYILFFLGKRES